MCRPAGFGRLADLSEDRRVHFCSDGLALSPAEYAQLLSGLASDGGVTADEFSRGGIVATLEERMAAMLGKEMAVFIPSGTLANNLALRLLARRGRRVLVQRESHIYNDSGDCAHELSGLTLVPLAPERATFTLAEVAAEVARAEEGRVSTPVGVISIESPVRRVLGEAFDFAEMQRIVLFAREKQIGLHLDGARLFLASAYTGISPQRYAELFDTVYVSLYKYFNAAGGAILAGPRELLDGLYHHAGCLAGASVRPGLMRRSRCIFLMGSAKGSSAQRPQRIIFGTRSQSTKTVKSCAPQQQPMSRGCGSPTEVPQPYRSGC